MTTICKPAARTDPCPPTVDQLAAAAGMLMTKASGHAAVWVTGVAIEGEGQVRELVRNPSEDLFR